MAKSSSYYFRQSFEILFIIVFFAILVRLFLFSSYRVSSVAMMPQLFPGDYIIGLKAAYGIPVPFSEMKIGPRSPRRGEISIIRSPEDESLQYVVRVVGIPGDNIEMREGKLIVNGEAAVYERVPSESGDGDVEVLEENFSWSQHLVMEPKNYYPSFKATIIPPEHFFVLGDFRNKSYDSRYFGVVSQSHLEARIFLVWFSLVWGPQNEGRWQMPTVRWNRVFETVP